MSRSARNLGASVKLRIFVQWREFKICAMCLHFRVQTYITRLSVRRRRAIVLIALILSVLILRNGCENSVNKIIRLLIANVHCHSLLEMAAQLIAKMEMEIIIELQPEAMNRKGTNNYLF